MKSKDVPYSIYWLHNELMRLCDELEVLLNKWKTANRHYDLLIEESKAFREASAKHARKTQV